MSNHSGESDPALQEHFAKLMESVLSTPLGPTGRFPRGKITPADEGEIRIAIAKKDGVVILNFGKPVTWIGFPPDEARAIAALLIKHADSDERDA